MISELKTVKRLTCFEIICPSEQDDEQDDLEQELPISDSLTRLLSAQSGFSPREEAPGDGPEEFKAP